MGDSMERLEKNSDLNNLEEDLKKLEKNEKAVYDLISLYEYLSLNKNCYNLVGINLVERVIQNLEDPDVIIPYKSNSILNLLITLYNQYQNIIVKYQNNKREQNDAFKKIRNSYRYKEKIIRDDLKKMNLNEKTEFNIIQEILSISPQLIYKFLVSEIPLDLRLEIFIDVLSATQDKNEYLYLDSTKAIYLSTEELKKFYKKIRELLKKMSNLKNRTNQIEELYQRFLNSDEKEMILLQNFGLNLNKYYWTYHSGENERLRCVKLSSVSYIFEKKGTLHSFKRLYEDKSYLTVPKKVRENNDFFILNTLNLLYIPVLINLYHFVVTKEKIVFLTIRIKKELESLNLEEEQTKNNYKKVVNEIAKALINKVKNTKEYEEISEYVKLFMESVSIDQEIEVKRREFATLLYNLNEYAQENVPGKRLVKEIKTFKIMSDK